MITSFFQSNSIPFGYPDVNREISPNRTALQTSFSLPLIASLIPISTSSLIASYGYGVDMGDILSLPIVYFCSDISI